MPTYPTRELVNLKEQWLAHEVAYSETFHTIKNLPEEDPRREAWQKESERIFTARNSVRDNYLSRRDAIAETFQKEHAPNSSLESIKSGIDAKVAGEASTERMKGFKDRIMQRAEANVQSAAGKAENGREPPDGVGKRGTRGEPRKPHERKGGRPKLRPVTSLETENEVVLASADIALDEVSSPGRTPKPSISAKTITADRA